MSNLKFSKNPTSKSEYQSPILPHNNLFFPTTTTSPQIYEQMNNFYPINIKTESNPPNQPTSSTKDREFHQTKNSINTCRNWRAVSTARQTAISRNDATRVCGSVDVRTSSIAAVAQASGGAQMDAVGGGGGGGEGRPADRRSQVSGIRQCRKAATKKGSGSNERWLRGSELIRWILRAKWRGNMELLRPIYIWVHIRWASFSGPYKHLGKGVLY